MIRHVWTVVAKDAFVDKQTNNVSLSILEQIALREPPPAPVHSTEKPAVLAVNYEVVTLWFCDTPPADLEYTVQLTAMGGAVLHEVKARVSFSAGSHRNRSRVIFDGLPFVGAGFYSFRVIRQLGSQTFVEAEVPLQVLVQPLENRGVAD